MDPGRVAPRGGARKTGRLVFEVAARRQRELALVRDAQQGTGTADHHMIVRQPLLWQGVQRLARDRFEAGSADQSGVHVIEVFGRHRSIADWLRVGIDKGESSRDATC